LYGKSLTLLAEMISHKVNLCQKHFNPHFLVPSIFLATHGNNLKQLTSNCSTVVKTAFSELNRLVGYDGSNVTQISTTKTNFDLQIISH